MTRYLSLYPTFQESVCFFCNLLSTTPYRPLVRLAYLKAFTGGIRIYQVPYKQLTTNLGFAHAPAMLCLFNLSLNKGYIRMLTIFKLMYVNIIWLFFNCYYSAAIHLYYPHWVSQASKPFDANDSCSFLTVRTSLLTQASLSGRLHIVVITHSPLGYYQRKMSSDISKHLFTRLLVDSHITNVLFFFLLVLFKRLFRKNKTREEIFKKKEYSKWLRFF